MKHPEGRLIVTTASLCYCSSRATIDICTQWAWLCYNKTLFTQVESQVQRWAIVCWPLVYCTSLIGPDAFVSVDPFLKRLSASLFKNEKMASFLQCPKKAAENNKKPPVVVGERPQPSGSNRDLEFSSCSRC